MEEVKLIPSTSYILATLEYPPQIGGVASFCAQFVKALPQGTITVVTNHNNQLLSKFIWPRWFKSIFTLWKTAKQTQAHGIIVAQVLPLGTAAVVVGKLLRIKVYVMVHGLDVLQPQQSWRKKRLLTWVLTSATAVIANSHYTAGLVQDLGVGHERVCILPLGPHNQPSAAVSGTHWIQSLNIPPSNTVILSAARLVKRKGIDLVIGLMPELVSRVTVPLTLMVVGDGPEEARLKDLAQKSGVSEKIIFTGRITDDQLVQLFERCQLFVLPTREEVGGDVEGFGIVFLEANAFGKPVIGGKSGGVPDAVVDGLNGYLIEPNNPEMLLKAMMKLIEHPEVAERLGEQGKKRVVEQFNWQTNVLALAKHLGLLV